MTPLHEPSDPSEAEAQPKRATRGRREQESARATTPPDFEQALARLEEIVAQLEGGQLSLDQALSLYEEGVRLYHACETILDSASLRLERLRIGDAANRMAGGAANDQEDMILIETFELDER